MATTPGLKKLVRPRTTAPERCRALSELLSEMEFNSLPAPYPGSRSPQLSQPSPVDAPAPPPARKPRWRGRLGTAAAAVLALLTKLKAVLLLLPKLKLFASAGTMLVSLAAYSFVFGWPFATGFVILLFVHEMGHVIALRREGIKASAPMFVPFLGALISARSLGDDALAEARVGLAGPVLGSLGAAACLLTWLITGNDIWRALAFTGFFLNLFNLLPVVPLDGGRAMAAMAPWMWFVGFGAMIPLAILFPNPIILLILLFAGYETYKRWQLRRGADPRQRAYYRVSKRNRVLVAAVYLSLIALLVAGMHATMLARTL